MLTRCSCIVLSVWLWHSIVETKIAQRTSSVISSWFNCCVLNVSQQNAGTDKSIFPLPEPQDVFLAAQVKFDDLNRDLRQLGRDLTSMWHHYCDLYLFQFLLRRNECQSSSPPLSLWYWMIISKTLVPLWASAPMWLGDRNSLALRSFCCVFLFENLSQAV